MSCPWQSINYSYRGHQGDVDRSPLRPAVGRSDAAL